MRGDVFEKSNPNDVATLVIIDESSIAMQIKEGNDPGAMTKEMTECLQLLHYEIHETKNAIAYIARDTHIEPNKVSELIARGRDNRHIEARQGIQGLLSRLKLPHMEVPYLMSLSPSANVAEMALVSWFVSKARLSGKEPQKLVVISNDGRFGAGCGNFKVFTQIAFSDKYMKAHTVPKSSINAVAQSIFTGLKQGSDITPLEASQFVTEEDDEGLRVRDLQVTCPSEASLAGLCSMLKADSEKQYDEDDLASYNELHKLCWRLALKNCCAWLF